MIGARVREALPENNVSHQEEERGNCNGDIDINVTDEGETPSKQ